jgi:hypothetical protein
MRFGSPIAAGFGAPANHLVECSVVSTGAPGIVRVIFTPATGFGDAAFQVLVNSLPARTIWCAEGEQRVLEVATPTAVQTPNVCILRLGRGDWTGYSYTRVARTYDPGGPYAVLLWEWAYDVIEPALGDTAPVLSNWTLTGLQRGVNCTPDTSQRTRASLSVALTVAGGVRTVSLYAGGVLVASGTRDTTAGAVTLTAANSSGLSGSVDLTASAVAVTATLAIRWPDRVNVYRDGTLAGSAIFDGGSLSGSYRDGPLAAGSYTFTLREISDSEDEGTLSAGLSVTIVQPPAPPASLRWWQGNANMVYLAIGPSPTAGCTYRLYLGQPGAAINLSEIAATYTESLPFWTPATVIARYAYRLPSTPNGYIYKAELGGTTGLTEPVWPTVPGAGVTDGTVLWSCQYASVTLPAITGYPGTAHVIARAVLGGVEEDNLNILALEFDAAGQYVTPRPNAPRVERISYSETLVQVQAVYDRTDELGVATQLQLFFRTPGGTYDYTSPAQSLSLTAGGTVQAVLLSAEPSPARQWAYCRVLAATVENVQSTAADSPEFAVWTSDEDMPAPANPQAFAARG